MRVSSWDLKIAGIERQIEFQIREGAEMGTEEKKIGWNIRIISNSHYTQGAVLNGTYVFALRDTFW